VYPITDRPRQHGGGPPRPARCRPPDGIVLAGAHGGAGTSTLAALLAPAWDTGVISGPAAGGLRSGGRPVVLAARNTVAAAGRAVTAASAVTRAGAWVAVLVVVSDGLPEPAEARYRFRVLEGRVGAVVRMPFVPAFRVTADPSRVDLPRRARQALAEIRALTREQAPRPAPATRVQGRF
jgi:hypothetical protein